MNEIIQKLYNKSWSKVDPTNPQVTFMNAFAEAIVRECAAQCTTEGPFVAEVVWGKQFHKKILEHFGVSE